MPSGWGGGPDGGRYVSPEEQAELDAAAEARERLAESRAADDRRTAAMADAIRDAGAMIADAIRRAAGDGEEQAEPLRDDRIIVENPPCMCPPGRVLVGCPVHGNGYVTTDSPEVAAWLKGDAADPDIDDLLNP